MFEHDFVIWGHRVPSQYVRDAVGSLDRNIKFGREVVRRALINAGVDPYVANEATDKVLKTLRTSHLISYNGGLWSWVK